MQWIVLLLCMAGAVAGWANKDNEDAEWAAAAIGVCLLGVVMSLIGGGVLFYYVMLVALGGVVYCYLQGVKQEKEWGPVGVAGCTGLIVVVLAGNAIGGCEGNAYAEKREESISKTRRLNRARMEHLGRYLADTMPGKKALLIQPAGEEKRAGEMEDALEDGLDGRLELTTVDAGAGAAPERVGGAMGPQDSMGFTVQAFDRLIERYSDCEVVVLGVAPGFDFRRSTVW
jgi:hypothetical protein